MTFRMTTFKVILMTKSTFVQYTGNFLGKLHIKKEQKVIGPFLRNQPLSEQLTMDNSALEKLRCLSAGGAKELSDRF